MQLTQEVLLTRFASFASLWRCFIAVIVLAVTIAAQTSRGTVSGIITDATGAVIPSAVVTLTGSETGVARTTTTNSEGLYRFEAVDPGTYSVRIAATNFNALVKSNIAVSANQIAQVDGSLTVGTTEMAVDVTAESGALLQTEAPVRGGNIEASRIEQMPLTTRNPVALALTLPGVSSNRGGAGIGTFSVNGGRGRSNNFLMDGTENNDISVAGQGFQIRNQDVVQEVSVQTSNYDAEFGRAGGAVVNVVTRSGTNQLHGSLNYQLDSTRDDAITSSQSRDPQVIKRGRPLPGIENFYSGTIGGPVIKNRTFFFGGYQESRQRFIGQSQLTAPTAAGRAALRALFPEGRSANVDLLLNVTKNAVANAAPFNVALGTVNGVNRGNVEFGTYFRSFNQGSLGRQWQTRVDHKLGENDQLSGRFMSDQVDALNAATFEGLDSNFRQRFANVLLSETHVFSPSLTNEVRLAYNRLDFGFPLAEPDGLAGTLPRITIEGLAATAALGVAANLPQGRIANNYTIQDTVTWVRGNHTWRGGVDFLRQIATQSAPFTARGALAFNASNGFTGLANFVDDFGGANGTATKDFGSPKYFPSLYRTAAFVQDRWRMSSALTVTLGVRYENFGTAFNTLRTPAFTGLFNVDPVTLNGPYSQPNKVKADNNNFAPTLGIAWSPSVQNGLLGRLISVNRTVIRTGYQIGYDSFFNNIASNASSSSPNTISTRTDSIVANVNPRGRANFSQSLPTAARALLPSDAQTLIAPNLVNPYFQRWSLGVQRELPFNLLVDVSYVGSKGTKLFITEDLNPLVRPEMRITPQGYTGATTGRYDNLQGQRNIRTNGGSSSFHSGQLFVQRRFSNNFSLTGAYSFSKNIDNASDVFAAAGVNGTPFFAIPSVFGGDRLERAVSQFDRTHVASFTWMYELPFQREQKGLFGRFAGGWQISGAAAMESGVPYSVLNGFDADGVGGNIERPTFNPNGRRGVRAVPVTDALGNITGYVNPDANNAPLDPATARYIVNPAYNAGLSGSRARIGNLGRHTERTTGLHNWNMSVTKRTRVREQMNLDFRAELFNAFNRPQYTVGNTTMTGYWPGGGSISSIAGTAVAGRFLVPNTPDSDGGGRAVRFNLKLSF